MKRHLIVATEVYKTRWPCLTIGLLLLSTAFESIAVSQWALQNSGTTRTITAIRFLSPQKGFAATSGGGGLGRVAYTTDGGESWRVNSNAVWLEATNDFSFLNDSLGLIVGGAYAFIKRTTDAGNTWTEVYRDGNSLVSLAAGAWLNSTVAIAVGHDYTTTIKGVILRSTDAGATWAKVNTPYDGDLSDILAVSDKLAFIVGRELIKSTDLGASWNVVSSNIYANYGGARKLFFYDTSNGIAVGNDILRTSDGGATWTNQCEVNNLSLYEVAAGGNVSIVSADFGKVFRSTDKGFTWSPETTSVNKPLLTISAINDSMFWVGGQGGSILKRRTANMPEATPAPILVRPADNSSVFWQDVVFEWRKVPLASHYRIQLSSDLTFNDNNNTPYFYDINLVNDTLYTSPSSMPLPPGTKFYWRVSATNSGGMSSWSQVRSFNPSTTSAANDIFQRSYNFSLFQNYPNPFNGFTNIYYRLPVESDVSIRIYDVLGRMIFQQSRLAVMPGYHSFVWNSENTPSGTYFYEIGTANFGMTKRMLLLK